MVHHVDPPSIVRRSTDFLLNLCSERLRVKIVGLFVEDDAHVDKSFEISN